jgi:serine/threonine protein kinase
MKRILASSLALILFGLCATAAATIRQPSFLALAGVALAGSTTVAADLLLTHLRRRLRRTPLPIVAVPAPAQRPEDRAQEPAAPGQLPAPVETLWSIPPLSESKAAPAETRPWLPLSPAQNEPQRRTPLPSTTTLIGRVVGPYQVQAQIGRGGMATVYKGFHPELQRPVALKVLDRSLIGTPELVQRFRREAQTIAALRHPNIVQVFDFGSLDDGQYLAMEYVEGSDLQAEMAHRREENRPFSAEEILRLLSQIADALDYAHRQGVIHRDVKPGNVLLTADGQPILSDFGLAALRRTRATLITTIGQNVLGTPEYTAPEQALDAQEAGPASDLYSLGCIAYELITGHLPFEAESALSIALAHIGEEPTLPSRHVPDLPAAVEAALLQALAKSPEDRFPTARALVEALRAGWEAST